MPGDYFRIENQIMSCPISDVWNPNVIGTNLGLLQVRSPYYLLTWTMRYAGPCDLDWYDYDNQVLDSIRTRTPGKLDEWETYTDVICQSVTYSGALNRAENVVATFLVRVV